MTEINWQDVLKMVQERGGIKIEMVDGGMRLSVTLDAALLMEVLNKVLAGAIQR